ncbi:acyl carrier protein [Prevotella cerevisiae]|uniref:Acyl carrier protein n=1 Tax=Segatella cerevisiae TaxID=2053716 RepID=A0ABT1BXU4_9BACT|nr:acyl carrier protein [Segatella cerevisiae]MCO6025890.1 acyl carrier protein [Segatella cerevisiae]
MERQEVLKTLNGIFVKVLKKPNLCLTENMSTDDIDEWDSLNNMIIIAEIEKQFHFHLKMRDIIRIKTVGDMCDVILKRTK